MEFISLSRKQDFAKSTCPALRLPIEIFGSNPIKNKIVENLDSSADSEIEFRTPSRKVPVIAEIIKKDLFLFYQRFAKKLTRSPVILVVVLTQILLQIFAKDKIRSVTRTLCHKGRLKIVNTTFGLVLLTGKFFGVI